MMYFSYPLLLVIALSVLPGGRRWRQGYRPLRLVLFLGLPPGKLRPFPGPGAPRGTSLMRGYACHAAAERRKAHEKKLRVPLLMSVWRRRRLRRGGQLPWCVFGSHVRPGSNRCRWNLLTVWGGIGKTRDTLRAWLATFMRGTLGCPARADLSPRVPDSGTVSCCALFKCALFSIRSFLSPARHISLICASVKRLNSSHAYPFIDDPVHQLHQDNISSCRSELLQQADNIRTLDVDAF